MTPPQGSPSTLSRHFAPISVPAPAKLNLMLHITGRRPDGYHELQSLFQLLDWGDELTFSPGTEQQPTLLTLIDDSTVAPQDNLITRAADHLQPLAGNPVPLVVRLHKVIPMGGGLGGGSSDAATTLLTLNRLWACDLDTDTLADLGRQLGADVPVFVRGHSAWAEGIGERLSPVSLPDRWFVIAHPGIFVSTGSVFNDPALTRNTQITTIRSALEGGGHNDCEPVVRSHYPAIDAMLNAMNAFGKARLTGTGACGFLSFATRAEASVAARALRSSYQVFIAHGINHSPVFQALTAADGHN